MKLLNIRKKIQELVYEYGQERGHNVSLREFCRLESINYTSINNAMQKQMIGLGLVNQLKQVFPLLNVNWFLYNEGDIWVKMELKLEKTA